ncbi:Hypothetical predicted protein [Cloeon dipterum]|uniref:Uncharacterized protein n=1 Tax=Cloeon dipterum TaxID=197152 RepID=A0A8S1D5G9_9INSE|nr:Hypothetical predicted protein [Cloeon dipterum]
MSSPKGSVNGLAPKRRPEQQQPHLPTNLAPQHFEIIEFISNCWTQAIQDADSNKATFFQPSHKDSKAAEPDHTAQRPRNT